MLDTPAQWFHRHGEPVTRPVAIDTPHTAHYTARPKCWRCGGAGGSEKWRHTGWTCYRCGGNGLDESRIYRVYSAEKLAKLDATKAKATARRLEKAAAKEAAKLAEGRKARRQFFRAFGPLLLEAYKLRHVNPFLGDLFGKAWRYGELSIGQLDAMPLAIERAQARLARDKAEAERKARARHVGKIGERIEQTLTLQKRITGNSTGVWGDAWSLKIFTNEDGCKLVTFGVCDLDEGDTARVKFTVKAHELRDGEPQTTITRLKIIEG